VRRLALLLAVGAAALGAASMPAFAAPVFVADCPEAPGAAEPGEIVDDAIETRNQRIADVAICEAYVERLNYLALHAERDTDVLTDVRWLTATGLGVFLASMVGMAFWRTFGRGELR
jgi:hypothetical protein